MISIVSPTHHKQILLITTLILASGCATSAPHEQETPVAEVESKSVSEVLIEKNKALAETLDGYADRIDLFFAEDRLTEDKNKTTLKLYNPLKWSEGGRVDFTPHFGILLHLPNLQERFKVRFTSFDEDETDVGTNRKLYRNPESEKKYGTSVEVMQELGSVRTTFRPRVEFSDELLTSYLIKFESTVDHSFWSFEPEFQVFARSDVGTGQFLGLNTIFIIDRANAIRLINEEQYTDGNNTMTTNHGLEVKHHYNEKMSQFYTVLFQTSNRLTFHNELIILRSQFEHKLRPEILHYSLTPVLNFYKEGNFHPQAELNVGVTVLF